jgi:hypothetical protein
VWFRNYAKTPLKFCHSPDKQERPVRLWGLCRRTTFLDASLCTCFQFQKILAFEEGKSTEGNGYTDDYFEPQYLCLVPRGVYWQVEASPSGRGILSRMAALLVCPAAAVCLATKSEFQDTMAIQRATMSCRRRCVCSAFFFVVLGSPPICRRQSEK